MHLFSAIHTTDSFEDPLIGSTKTRSGLRVKARLDKKTYPTKVKISDEEMRTLNLLPHRFHGDWNYTVKPT